MLHVIQMSLVGGLWVLFAIALMTDCRGRERAKKIRRVIG